MTPQTNKSEAKNLISFDPPRGMKQFPFKHNRLGEIFKIGILLTAFSLCGLSTASAKNRTLVILQENGGKLLYLDNIGVPANVQSTIAPALNGIAVTFEIIKATLQGAGKYQRTVNLTDANCTRAKLLDALIRQRRDGFDVDLLVMGHGSPESLGLHGETLTGGATGSIRTLLTDARAREGASFNFSLRLVYMCNCFAASVNDDWMAIGAKVSIGSRHVNYMAEPMITSFMHNFLFEQRPVSKAVDISFNDGRTLWGAVSNTYFNSETGDPPCSFWGGNTSQKNDCLGKTRIRESQPVLAGNAKLIFLDENQFALNQTRTFSIPAKNAYNFPSLFVSTGETYTFTASTTDTWKNCTGCCFGACEKSSNADGYDKGPTDFPRQSGFKMFALLGEHFRKFNDITTYDNVVFKIGTSKTYSPSRNGYINMMANDILTGYGDNTGSISVTVKRTH